MNHRLPTVLALLTQAAPLLGTTGSFSAVGPDLNPGNLAT